jgi:hypothetical protein
MVEAREQAARDRRASDRGEVTAEEMLAGRRRSDQV